MNQYCNTIKLNKEQLGNKQIIKIKKDLTVSPTNSYITNLNNIPKIKIYKETKSSIYIPKYYGFNQFNNFIKNDSVNGLESTMSFNKNLNDYQIPCVTKIIESCKTIGGGLLCVPCGFGKCLAQDTPIVMYDGSIKKVQNIYINDLIMGDDSTPRRILSTCVGSETMYRIEQLIGDDYIVNESHILTIQIENKIVDKCISQLKLTIIKILIA